MLRTHSNTRSCLGEMIMLTESRGTWSREFTLRKNVPGIKHNCHAWWRQPWRSGPLLQENEHRITGGSYSHAWGPEFVIQHSPLQRAHEYFIHGLCSISLTCYWFFFQFVYLKALPPPDNPKKQRLSQLHALLGTHAFFFIIWKSFISSHFTLVQFSRKYSYREREDIVFILAFWFSRKKNAS